MSVVEVVCKKGKGSLSLFLPKEKTHPLPNSEWDSRCLWVKITSACCNWSICHLCRVLEGSLSLSISTCTMYRERTLCLSVLSIVCNQFRARALTPPICNSFSPSLSLNFNYRESHAVGEWFSSSSSSSPFCLCIPWVCPQVCRCVVLLHFKPIWTAIIHLLLISNCPSLSLTLLFAIWPELITGIVQFELSLFLSATVHVSFVWQRL